MRADQLNLKELAWYILNNPIDASVLLAERDMVLPCFDVLSLISQAESANLGLATTRELLDEIRARIEVDGKLDYKTVGDDHAA